MLEDGSNYIIIQLAALKGVIDWDSNKDGH